MNELIHYTSNKKWNQIKRVGYLLPFSSPQNVREDISDRVRRIVGYKKYVVGIQAPPCDNWIEYGLINYLLNHTTGEVKLRVPILEPNNCFVRDHAHLSPKGTEERYGINLFKLAWEKEISSKDKRLLECIEGYYESTVKLEEYDGGYNVPEIWLDQITPINQLNQL
ncbi:MAG: hypothetical protein Q8Q01_01195 [archaeon]|nr:hypothetical protein [archaeon]